MCIRECEIDQFCIMIDYQPRRFNAQELRNGNSFELLNLVNWGGIKLHMRKIKLFEIHGFERLVQKILLEWMYDIKKSQVTFKFNCLYIKKSKRGINSLLDCQH